MSIMGKTKDKQSRKSETKAIDAVAEAGRSGPSDKAAAEGRALRKQAPRSGHAEWHPGIDRRDPIEILIESSAGRVPHLLPIRYGRMVQSPFAFYRGAAAIMAADLARTPSTGLRVQACGDCHLLNFGVFATPERRLIFDVNDFDETLPAPWEWDVKRLAASFAIAAAHNEFKSGQARAAVLACARSYRQRMARFAKMPAIDVWYERVDVEQLLARTSQKVFSQRDRAEIVKAEQGSCTEHISPKLLEQEGQGMRIHDNPPLIYHPEHAEAVEFIAHLHGAFERYRKSLPDERRVLLDRYTLADHAIKVVGVGSVGTRCGILLLSAGPNDPLLLQVKEARPSVLEPYAGKSKYDNCGERVAIGQRLMQAASDLFLGWTRGEAERDFYVRQLRDVKVKPLVEAYDPTVMAAYAESCGWALARAHARSSEPKAISAYLGSSDRFDEAVADFAESYAEQNEQDYREFRSAIRTGRLPAEMER
jgi:uncharacterized protein (DUF2252 family)